MNFNQTLYVFIHGAWHGAWCWQAVIERMRQLGHNAIAFDLPGSGGQIMSSSEITLRLYRETVVEQLISRNEKMVLVGHSMGGAVISQVAEKLPHLVSHLCFVSAYLLADGETIFSVFNRDEQSELSLDQMVSQGGGLSLPDLIAEKIFYHDCDEMERKKAVERLGSQSVKPLLTALRLTEDRFGSVPKSYVLCRLDRCISFVMQKQMLNNWTCEQVVELNSGHSPFISCPNDLSDAVLSLTAG